MSPAEDFESLELGFLHIFWFKKSENKNINSMKKVLGLEEKVIYPHLKLLITKEQSFALYLRLPSPFRVIEGYKQPQQRLDFTVQSREGRSAAVSVNFQWKLQLLNCPQKQGSVPGEVHGKVTCFCFIAHNFFFFKLTPLARFYLAPDLKKFA